jgi:diadenosine tetraphosphate (Ap4A) HIT family hydrolase
MNIGRGKISTIILNRNQNYYGRVIVVLKRHETDVLKLSSKDFLTFMRDAQIAARIVRQTVKCDRINLAILGNRVAHLHCHIIPRFKGEPNFRKPPWPRAERRLSAGGYKALVDMMKEQV